jgi:hypothetical protein
VAGLIQSSSQTFETPVLQNVHIDINRMLVHLDILASKEETGVGSIILVGIWSSVPGSAGKSD